VADQSLKPAPLKKRLGNFYPSVKVFSLNALVATEKLNKPIFQLGFLTFFGWFYYLEKFSFAFGILASDRILVNHDDITWFH